MDSRHRFNCNSPLFYYNNSSVTILPVGTVNCKFTIVNNTDSDATPVISIAAYKGSKLVKLQMLSTDNTSVNQGAIKNLSINIDVPADCDYIKFLGFESMASLKPVTNLTKRNVQIS